MALAANTPTMLRAGLVEGDTSAGVLASGQVVGLIDDLPSAKVLIDRGDYRAAIAQLAEQHRLGRFDHGRLLWQLLILERSLQHLFGLGRFQFKEDTMAKTGQSEAEVLRPRVAKIPLGRLGRPEEIARLAVVLASALLRMRLYIDVYGLTQLRFFTTAFMFWLVVVFPLESVTW